MTIPEHIEILRRGPRVWNTWRAENPSIVPDLEGIALSIGDRQLGPINGGPINLSRALLADATLYFATLTGADMRGTDLTNADLRGARLEGVDLTGADLAGAQLDGASMAGAVLKAANLSGASLANVRDLTPDQVGEAEGNLGTVLPNNLPRPALWSIGQGTLDIETAHSAVEAAEDVYESPAGHEPSVDERIVEEPVLEEPDVEAPYVDDTAANGHAVPAPMFFHAATEPEEAREWDTAAEPEIVQEPEIESHVEPEPEPLRAEPVRAEPGEMRPFSPAPTLPRVEARETRPVHEPLQPQPTVQSMAMRSNGHDHQHSQHGDSESKHVSWLVGGPRRVGRPVRNWRDRA
jgi:hypothetical protein